MSNDPLDAVFVTGDEAAALKRADTARKLATYLERMPVELRSMFTDEFQHINRAELAQLRADLQAAQERIEQQAEQLEQAREIFLFANSANVREVSYGLNDAAEIELDRLFQWIQRWLSHAAPQPVSAFAAIDKLMSEHPDLFKDDQQPQEQSA